MPARALADALTVSGRQAIGSDMATLIEGLRVEVVAVAQALAGRMVEAYSQWGEGVHRTSLNLGDCFCHDVAKQCGCPLLDVGDDFARTDIKGASSIGSSRRHLLLRLSPPSSFR